MKNMIYLKEADIPQKWLNSKVYLPDKLPESKDPDDGSYSRVNRISQLRTRALIEQDHSEEEWIDIPGEVLEKYLEVGRPTPLMRAKELEECLGTPARIYIKREDLLPTHSFKLNTAIAQAYYAKEENLKGLISETGAGQWGLSIAYACNMFGIEATIFWVRVSMEQKYIRRAFGELLGAKIYPSPSNLTKSGREMLKKDPNCYGSLGTAIGDAISYTLENEGYKYASGSNLTHILLHQSIIGLEAKKQLELIGEKADIVIACCGGGSNFGGIVAPFIKEKIENSDIRFIAAESDAAPRLSKGKYEYDFSDPLGLTPLSLSYTLGHDYMPPPVHTGGLRQHNGSVFVGYLKHKGLIDAYAYSQEEIFKVGQKFAQMYRVIPAPETCHALKAAVDVALECKEKGESKNILVSFSGSGLLDLKGYMDVLKI